MNEGSLIGVSIMGAATDYTKTKECEVKALPLETKRAMVKEGKAHWFFPHHLGEQALQCLALIAILLLLTVVFPAHLGPMADPFDTPAHIKPEWYFLAGFYFLKLAQVTEILGAWAPKFIGVIGQGIPVALLFIVPWLDRSASRAPSNRKLVLLCGALGFATYVAMTILGGAS